MTTDLAPDEKRCPFCAETIKAAAIRCRFCQSDLPTRDERPVPLAKEDPLADDSTPSPEAALPPPPPAPDLHEESEETEETEASSRGRRLVAALAVLCLLLGGLLWFLVDRAEHPDLATAPNGQVTESSFRNAAMSAASDAAAKALSYSWKTFEQDRAAAKELMGPALTKQYDEAMEQVAEQTASSKLTLQSTVLSVGLISAKEHSAKALLFVNTVTTRDGAKNQQLDQNRVLMELTRKDGDWTVSKMDAF